MKFFTFNVFDSFDSVYKCKIFKILENKLFPNSQTMKINLLKLKKYKKKSQSLNVL
jgi:hypothetical protein